MAHNWIKTPGFIHSDLDLTGPSIEVLRLLAIWVAQVYLPMFFCNQGATPYCTWVDTPHTPASVAAARPEGVGGNQALYQDRGLVGTSWAGTADSADILWSSRRKFAIQQIWKIRGSSDYGSTSIRTFKTPDSLNIAELARSWSPGTRRS